MNTYTNSLLSSKIYQYIKRCVFIICIITCVACEQDEHEELLPLMTRTIPGQIISGEKNPYVGELYYTYTLDLGKKYDKEARVTVYTSKFNGYFRGNGQNFNVTSKTLSVPVNTSKVTFDIYWTQEDPNAEIYISNLTSNVQVDAMLTGINVKKQNVPISASLLIGIGDNVTLTAPYHLINNYHRAVWNYDKNLFSLVSEDYSIASSCYKLVLKAIKGGVQSKISVNIDETFLQNWLTVRKGEHSITINDPFKITVNNKFIANGEALIAELPNLSLAPKATVTWEAGTGLSIISGQKSSKAVFEASATVNGYSSIWANINDNGNSYLRKIDSIWIGKPVITSDATKYFMQRRNTVTISPTIKGAQSISWSIVSGNATLMESSDKKQVTIRSNAPFTSSDTIVVSMVASNRSGSKSQQYQIDVPSLAEINFTRIIKSNNSISGEIFCNRNDVDITLMLDWGFSEEGSITFKIQDKFYIYNEGADSKFVTIHLDSTNNFVIVADGANSDVNIGAIYIVDTNENGYLGQQTALSLQ
ncbi:hypothetical protein [Bacteroides timonensis]|uniref:hypothetical protein n=1 Tax=Bacteroides timonensis TaxID=1470345 RepID=UPI0004AC9EAB|nr:hypothetical protein [Bacteroides timonensis]